MRKLFSFVFTGVHVFALLTVAGCFDTGTSNQSYTVSGTVDGLVGSGLVLQNNNRNDLAISSNGAFTFTDALSSGSSYVISVTSQPSSPRQTCTVSNGSGAVTNSNVSNISVTCVTNTYAVGGVALGLVGTGLILQNNSTDNLSVGTDGTFIFNNRVTSGSGYSVSVLAQPSAPSQTCTVLNGSGIGDASEVTDVEITCVLNHTIGGTASGIPASGVLLQNNGGDDLTINANGSFLFSTPIPSGSAYSVTWTASTPSGSALTCEVVYGSGTISSSDVTNVQLNCMYLSVVVGLKQLTFSWAEVLGATYYRMLSDPDGTSIFDQIGSDIVGSGATVNLAVHQTNWSNARFAFQACNDSGCGSQSDSVGIAGKADAATVQLKASNDEPNDRFGGVVAISGDGATIAVGAEGEASAATGVNNVSPGQGDNSAANNSGAVYVFVKSANVWIQQAYVKASNTTDQDAFGKSISLSADGNTLVVGAPGEASAATGINNTSPGQSDNSADGAGAVYIFTRTNDSWTQQAYIKASNAAASARFGWAISLSSDGSTLAVGSYAQDGAAYVYVRSGSTWTEQAILKASNHEINDYFGYDVSLSDDGNAIAVGAPGEDSASTGVNNVSPGQADNSADYSGAAYVFNRSGSVWTQQAYVKASNTGAGDYYGYSVALNSDGSTLAVGAQLEASAATGIDSVSPSQNDNSAPFAGAVYVYYKSSGSWSQQAYIKSPVSGASRFGWDVALNDSGETLSVGATNTNPSGIGKAFTFKRTGGVWAALSEVAGPGTDQTDEFGSSVSLSTDGTSLLVGAPYVWNSFTSGGAAFLY